MLIAVVDKKLLGILFLFLTLNASPTASLSDNSDETVLEGKSFAIETVCSN